MHAHSGRRESFLVGQPVQEQTIIRSPALGSSRHAGSKDLQGFGHSQAGKNIKPIGKGKKATLVREIRGRVRRKSGRCVDVRFWTNLLDIRQYPAKELLGLYARRL